MRSHHECGAALAIGHGARGLATAAREAKVATPSDKSHNGRSLGGWGSRRAAANSVFEKRMNDPCSVLKMGQKARNECGVGRGLVESDPLVVGPGEPGNCAPG